MAKKKSKDVTESSSGIKSKKFKSHADITVESYSDNDVDITLSDRKSDAVSRKTADKQYSSEDNESDADEQSSSDDAATIAKTESDEREEEKSFYSTEEIAHKTEATVYIEGIPYSCDEGDIVSHFVSCGVVKEVRMPRYQDSGKPRGYAHVVFESASSIPAALKLDKEYLKGRYLTVQQSQKPRTIDIAITQQKQANVSVKRMKGCKTVFVKQLPYDIEEEQVKEALSSCGKIVSVRLPLWNNTKNLKGFGYVEFEKEEEALAAVKKSGMKIASRMVLIQLELDTNGPKASFRNRNGQYWNKGEEGKKILAKRIGEKSLSKSRNANMKLRKVSRRDDSRSKP